MYRYTFDEDLGQLEPDVFWNKLFDLKNDGDVYLFRNPARIALDILSLPHSNCDCERVFSKINRTKSRNPLIDLTVRGILLASQKLATSGGCSEFQPSDDMLARMTKDSLYDKKKPSAIDSSAVASGAE